MELTEKIADELALQALEVVEKTDDDRIIKQISDVMGASSQTLQEAFMTAVRVRRAETRARELLASALARADG